MEYAYTQCTYPMHACSYMHARLATPTNGSPMCCPPPTRAHGLRPCARVCVCDWAPAHLSRHMRAPSAGSQAFQFASAFNADIGAWNTAHVTTLQSVCAASRAGQRATAGGTRSAGCSMRRGPLCAAGLPMRARVYGCADEWARACAGVRVCRYSCAYERWDTRMYVWIHASI
jgi:hypothetical protein